MDVHKTPTTTCVRSCLLGEPGESDSASLILHRIRGVGAQWVRCSGAKRGHKRGDESGIRKLLQGLAVPFNHALCGIELRRELGSSLAFSWSSAQRGPRRPSRGLAFSSISKNRSELILSPIIERVSQPLVHHRVKAGVLLDEDVAEGAVLAQQDGLHTD
jgi:hypothetical protein